MSKKIFFTDKRTIDKLNNKKPVREVSNKWNKNHNLINKKNQISILNQLFLENDFEGKAFVKKEVERKVRSYKSQDIKKNFFNANKFIIYDDLMEKLVISKLKCYYCRCQCLLMYDSVREKKQWTLDRINNDLGHHNDNTVVCCLECNLKKGTMNDEKFKFTKQLRIKKLF
jgi:hypothetical protein